MSKPSDGYHSNEEWVRDAYERRDFENLADKLERFAKGKHIPKTLRKNMFATAWDMKQYARRGTASFGV